MQDHRRRRLATIGVLGSVALITATACGDSQDNAGDAPSPTSSPTSSPSSASATSTGAPELTTCTNEESGYTVAHPETWHTNPGDVAPPCTYFDPESFTLEEETEADTAIELSQTDTDFATASSPDAFDRVGSRDSATVDGREAVAVVEEASGDGLLDEGTLSYTWLIDVDTGTFVASTHDGPDRDFDVSMDVLDKMISNLDFAAPAPDETGTPPEATDGTDGDDEEAAQRTVIARYENGGQPFAVAAVHTADEICLVARAGGAEGDPSCWTGQPDHELTMRALDVPGGANAIGGIAIPRLSRVLAGLEEQGTVGFRPSEVSGAEMDAWAMPVGQPETRHVVGYTSDNRMASMLDAEGEPMSVLPNVNTAPESTEPSEDIRLLTGVDSGLHAGYDRVAFRFQDEIPGYDVSYEERPVEEAGSGREVDVAGDAVILVQMQGASGRERSGEGEQTYTGPERLSGAGTYAITEIVRTGDFEGTLTWAIGVRGELPMRVQEFGDDLVVDVRHPEE